MTQPPTVHSRRDDPVDLRAFRYLNGPAADPGSLKVTINQVKVGPTGAGIETTETSPTTCATNHFPARTPARLRDEHGWRLDCPCDVECPRCHAAASRACQTLDGGGTSGGGYSTSFHAARTKISPRCQGLLDGTRDRCDIGDHDWVLDAVAQEVFGIEASTLDAAGHHARCARCDRHEPVRFGPRPTTLRLPPLA